MTRYAWFALAFVIAAFMWFAVIMFIPAPAIGQTVPATYRGVVTVCSATGCTEVLSNALFRDLTQCQTVTRGGAAYLMQHAPVPVRVTSACLLQSRESYMREHGMFDA